MSNCWSMAAIPIPRPSRSAMRDAVVQSYAAQLRSDAQVQRGGQPLRVPVDPRIRVWYNSDLKSKNFIVPGLIAVTMMIIASMLSSLTIAREWENGTMEQLLSTPVRPERTGARQTARLLRARPRRHADLPSSSASSFSRCPSAATSGSCSSPVACSCSARCRGAFSSPPPRARSCMAFQMGMLSSFLPGYLLSGFIYSIQNMPKVIQFVSYIVPARYFVTILNGVFLKGVGIPHSVARSLMLAVYAGLVFRGRIAQDAAEGGLTSCENDCSKSFARNSGRLFASRACGPCCSCRPSSNCWSSASR